MKQKSRGRIEGQGGGQRVLGTLSLFLLLCLMVDAPGVVAAVKEGMLLLFRSMIPSLFPFMVVSELIVRSGAGERLAHMLRGVIGRAFGLGDAAGCALLLGFLCGFPVGSRAAANGYRAGRMSRREFVLTVCMCNVPSSAFLVSAVGLCLFGTPRMGWSLVFISLIASVLTGLLFRLLLPSDGAWQQRVSAPSVEVEQTGGQVLSASIASAAGGMLQVCATVLLFCALVSVVSRFCRVLTLGDALRVGILGLLELSTGVSAAAALDLARLSPVLCAAMVGWAGLSVHCQIFAVCQGCPLPKGWFFLSRALQAGMCGAAMALWIRWGGIVLPAPESWQEISVGGRVSTSGFSCAFCWVCDALLALGVCLLWRRFQRRKRGESA